MLQMFKGLLCKWKMSVLVLVGLLPLDTVQGYMPTVSFPGFWQLICSQHNAWYRKHMLPHERTGKIPNVLTTESIHLKKKKAAMFIKNLNSAKLLFKFFSYTGFLPKERWRASVNAFPFDVNLYRQLGILCYPIRATYRSSIILKRLQPFKWLLCWE